jgi:hypothetical protein
VVITYIVYRRKRCADVSFYRAKHLVDLVFLSDIAPVTIYGRAWLVLRWIGAIWRRCIDPLASFSFLGRISCSCLDAFHPVV